MADSITYLQAHPTPLTTADGAGLRADIDAHGAWQPSFLLETQAGLGTTPGGAGLAASGDIWRVCIVTPAAMPGMVFYPVCLRANFMGSVAVKVPLADFMETTALYTLFEPYDTYVWDTVDLSGVVSMINASSTTKVVRTVSPPMAGFPPRPGVAVYGNDPGDSLSAFQFQVKTWDPDCGTNVLLSVDARFLAFPRAAMRSGGFYSQRLGFKTA